MGAVVVVPVRSVGRHARAFLQRFEDPKVQHLGAAGLVEPFDIGILRGFARLDVLQRDAILRSEPIGPVRWQ